MANTVVHAGGIWPEGTSVKAFTPAAEVYAAAGTAPATDVSAVDTKTVTSGDLTFTALTAGQRYLLYGAATNSDVTRTAAGTTGVNEVDVVTIRGINGKQLTGGTFKLTVDTGTGGPQTTAPLKYDASAADVLIALENLSNIGVGDVTVTAADGGPYTLTFGGALAETPITTTVDASGLEGGIERRWVRMQA